MNCLKKLRWKKINKTPFTKKWLNLNKFNKQMSTKLNIKKTPKNLFAVVGLGATITVGLLGINSFEYLVQKESAQQDEKIKGQQKQQNDNEMEEYQIQSEKEITHEDLLRHFNKEIDKNPYLARNYHQRGIIYLYLNRLEDALEDFTRASMISPAHSMNWYKRGITNLMLNRVEDAFQDFTNAIKINPHFSQGKLIFLIFFSFNFFFFFLFFSFFYFFSFQHERYHF